jgi:hypothetical protein
LFYFPSAAYFGHGFHLTSPVSSTSSRKSFLAKIGGLVAATGLLPGSVVKTGAAAAVATSAKPVQVRTETRAVARGSGNL